MTRRLVVALVFLALFVTPPARAAAPEEMAAFLLKAEAAGAKWPVLSLEFGPLDLKAAYAVQRAYVAKKAAGDPIAGYKAGLTTPGAQQRFGVKEAVVGALWSSGRFSGAPRIAAAKRWRAMAIETEVGYVLKEAITARPASVEELKGKIGAVMPAIELPDLGFADMSKLGGPDIVAANVSAVGFIVGPQRPCCQGLDPNAVKVRLSRDGQELSTGLGAEALGDQWRALLWLVGAALDMGYQLKPGHLLITGALGKVVPGQPGDYTADYGDFGQIQFTIE